MENINILNEILKVYADINKLLGFDCLIIIAIILGVRILRIFVTIKSIKMVYITILLCSMPTFFFEWFIMSSKLKEAFEIAEAFRIALCAPFIAVGFYAFIKGLFPKWRFTKWLVNGKLK